MKRPVKSLMLLIIVLAFILLVKGNSNSQNTLVYCCNNNFPLYSEPKTNPSSITCDQVERFTTCEICARYWSAYGPDPSSILCPLLPDPPLPAIPIPANFSVSQTGDYHPRANWNWYYVHWYDFYRKTDGGSWQNVQRITSRETQTWIDTGINLLQGHHTYYYKMQGSVYDAYSSFTEVKSIQSVFFVTISGPSYLAPYQVGTFTANVTGGVPPFNYTWYKMQLCAGGESQSGGEPLGPPCNV